MILYWATYGASDKPTFLLVFIQVNISIGWTRSQTIRPGVATFLLKLVAISVLKTHLRYVWCEQNLRLRVC